MRSVLVTGTSSGIGQSIALELAKGEWRVYASMRNLERKGALESALAAAGVRERVEIVELDVTDPASAQRALAQVLSETGGTLDALINNAGVSVAGAFEDLSEDDVRRVMETNFFGVLSLTRQVLPVMRARRQGRLVFITSEAAFFGLPANSVYSASKWAVEGWAESLAYDLAPFGIDVVLVEPGPYRTPIWQTTKRVIPPDSAYAPLMRQVSAAGDSHAALVARDPIEVARKVARILDARRPRFRNPVGPAATLNHLLRGKVPSSALRWVLTRYLGLNRIRP